MDGRSSRSISPSTRPNGGWVRRAGPGARLYTFPTIGAWSDYEVTDLTPGTIALIPAGTGHRGCDVFAHIVTVPGFKPGNELYLDRGDPRWHGRGAAPHNPALAAAESSAPLLAP